jgi:O-antigen ligase
MQWILMGSILPLLAVIVRTGSRAGLASFAIGFATFLLSPRRSQRRWSLVAMGILVAGALGTMLIQNPILLTRVYEGYSGNLAGRQVLIPASLAMIREQPLLGWQPVAYWEELARRVGQIWAAKDAHNLVLHLLLEVGLVGALPFLIGLFLCVRHAWRARSGSFGALPLALMLATLSANFTHTYLTRKPQWLVLAFAVAAGTSAQRKATISAPHRSIHHAL